MENTNGLVRRVRTETHVQEALLDVPAEWKQHWWGMPSFAQADARPAHRITVNFICRDDLVAFANRLGLSLTTRTDSIWYPAENIDAPSLWEYADEP